MSKELLQYIQELKSSRSFPEGSERDQAYNMALDKIREKIIEITGKQIIKKHEKLFKKLAES